MARSRVPIKGSIGKSILTGKNTPIVQNTTVVQQVTRTVGGVSGGIAATLWPLISQIPTPVLDLAALSTSQVGLLAFNGTDLVERSIAVTGPLSISNPTGAAGNPTLGFNAVGSNQVLAGPTPSFRSLTTSDIPTLPAAQISGLATVATTGLLTDLGDVKVAAVADADTLLWVAADGKWENFPSSGGGGTVTRIGLADLSTNPIYAISGSPIATFGTLDLTLLTQTANKVFAGPATGSVAAPTFRSLTTSDIPTLPAAQISGLATVATTGLASSLSGLATIATTGSASDLGTGTVPSARLPLASSSVFGAVKVDGTTITAVAGVISSSGGGGGTTLAAAILADTPFAFWKCDDASTSLADSSGNGFNLTTVTGTPTFQSGPMIPTLGSSQFINFAGYIATTTAHGFQLTSTLGRTFPFTNWTFECVASMFGLTTGIVRLFDWRTSGTTSVIALYNNGGPLSCALNNTNIPLLPTGILGTGKPYHIVVTCSTVAGTSTLTSYINGVRYGAPVTAAASTASGGTSIAGLGDYTYGGTTAGVTIGYVALFPAVLSVARIGAHAQAAGLLGV